MDLNEIRIAWTVVSFIVFLAIVAWAYSGGAREGFDEAARLPLDDDVGRPAARAPVSGESAR